MRHLILFVSFMVVAAATAMAAPPEPIVFQEWDCKYRYVDLDEDGSPDVIQVHFYNPDVNGSDVDAFYAIQSMELVTIVWKDSDGTEFTMTTGFGSPGPAPESAGPSVVKKTY